MLKSSVTQNYTLAIRSPFMPNFSSNFSTSPSTIIQAANFDMNFSKILSKSPLSASFIPPDRNSTLDVASQYYSNNGKGKESGEENNVSFGTVGLLIYQGDDGQRPVNERINELKSNVQKSEAKGQEDGSRLMGKKESTQLSGKGQEENKKRYVEHSEEWGGVSLNPADWEWCESLDRGWIIRSSTFP
jgi:hypothetical protein